MTLDLARPSAGQRAMIERGYGMFIHFGINTFNEVEWSDGTLPVESYNPTALDCDGWIRVAREAGFRHVVLITKHHDGFCLWPPKNTAYSVASSPVPTDVVGEVTRACRKYGVKFGLYYSLWDRHEPTYQSPDPAVYGDWMKAQLTELLTNYGEVCEMWFDGGWVRPRAEWNIPDVYAHIKALQPACQVTVNLTVEAPGEPESRRFLRDYVEGDPLRYWPVDFRSYDPFIARWDDPKIYATPAGESVYLPFEHTICLSEHWNWFQKEQIMPARSLDELEELFYWGTKGDQVLIVNVPPDLTGRLRPNEVEAILALADRLGIRGGDKPLPAAPHNQAWGCPVIASSTLETSTTPAATSDAGVVTNAANVNAADAKSDTTFEAARAVDFSLETRWAAGENVADLTLCPTKPFEFDRVVIHEYPDTRDLGDSFSRKRVFRVQEWVLESGSDGE